MKNSYFWLILLLSFLGKGLLIALLIIGMFLFEFGFLLTTIVGSCLVVWLLSSIIYRGKPMNNQNAFQEWITHFLMLICLLGLVGFVGSILWSITIEKLEEKIIYIFLSMLIIGFTPYYKVYQDGINKK